LALNYGKFRHDFMKVVFEAKSNLLTRFRQHFLAIGPIFGHDPENFLFGLAVAVQGSIRNKFEGLTRLVLT